MTPHTIELEDEILAVFNRAYRQGRLDVAEHLLQALETSSASDNDRRRPPRRPEPLAEAYVTITRLYPTSRANG